MDEPRAELGGSPLWVSLSSKVIRTLPAGRYRAMHALSRFTPNPFVGVWKEDGRPLRFACDLRDAISLEVCYAGVYEPHIRAILRAVLGPGSTFVDVGANWGYFTLLSSLIVGPSGRVVSLEPDPRIFSLLQTNISLNGLDNVDARRQAAADVKGTLELFGFDESSGNFGRSSVSSTRRGGSGVTFEVEAVRLDELGGEGDTIDAMKMDIEGGEANAIPGCEGLLRDGRIKVLLVEFHPDECAHLGQPVNALAKMLVDAGYEGYVVDDSLEATRKFAYGKRVSPRTIMSPYSASQMLHVRPQTLWTAPGVELPF